ncbi:hypothetical protein ES706_03746 [subsurface metagenome]
MFICEFEFDQPDTENPDYSMPEVDYYAWTPLDKQRETGVPNHRLSLRKNLVTGKFEVYRRFFHPVAMADLRRGIAVATGVDTGTERVAFEGGFLEALRFADNEWKRFHGGGKEPDEPCQHRYPEKATFCPVYEELKKARETSIADVSSGNQNEERGE